MSTAISAPPPAPAHPAGPAHFRESPRLGIVLLVAAATLIAFLPALRGGFIWDDDTHLTANACVVGPLGFTGIWTSGEAQYYPLAVSNLWLQYQLWGLDPLPYHVVTLLLHAGSAVLLGLVLTRMRIPGAWLGSLLWAAHPVQAESVAWISETNSTQSALFFLLSLWFFLKWIEPEAPDGRNGALCSYALAFGFAVLAVLSKSSTVMLPVAMGLAGWWVGRWRWRRLPWLVPFFFISAVFSLWTIWEQKFHSGAMGAEWDLNGMERLIIAGRSAWFYLDKLLWPHPLLFFYPRWQVRPERWESYLPTALAAGVLGLLWWRRNGALRPVFFAYAWFLALLFPVMGFFNVFFFKYSFVADHFAYLASMGPLALAGAGLTALGRKAPGLARMLMAAIPLGLGALTWSQCGLFHDDQTLYRTTLAQNPDCWVAHNNLGVLLAGIPGRLPEAIAEYEVTLRLKPDYAEANNNLGNALSNIPGRLPEAIAHYEEALRIKPSFPEAHLDLGNALARSPQHRLQAIGQFEAALRINPRLAKAHNSLGNSLAAIPGRESDAVAHYQEALRINPAYSQAHYGLGLLLSGLSGHQPEAVSHYEEALRINPVYVEAHTDLANLLLKLPGRRPEAIAHYREALRLDPGYLPAHYNLGIALAGMPGRRNDAVGQFEEVLRIRPGYQAAQRMLARLQR